MNNHISTQLNILICTAVMAPGDTYVRFLDNRGDEVAQSDDGGCGRYRGSRLVYWVEDKPRPCYDYFLVQGCYGTATCGGTAYITVLRPGHPTSLPSGQPTFSPSSDPTSPSGEPSGAPSLQPSGEPSYPPSFEPSATPSRTPLAAPSCSPTSRPSNQPSSQPSVTPPPPSHGSIILLLEVLLPLSSLLLAGSAFVLCRHYWLRYTVKKKVACVKYFNQDILKDIDLFEEF